MKRFLIVLMALALFMGCAAREGSVQQSGVEETTPRLMDIEVVSGEEGQEIRLMGNGPLPYTIYKPGDPYHVIIELTDATMAEGLGAQIQVPEGNIVSIAPQVITEPNQLVRIEVALGSPVELTPESEGNMLVFRLPADGVGMPAVLGEGVAETVQADTAAVSAEAAPAAGESYTPPQLGTRIEDVAVSMVDGKTVVRIEGDGLIAGDVFSLSDDRIVVDIPKVTTDLQYVTVSESPLERVRLGQHSDKVRIVLDVDRHMDWALKEEGAAIVLTLTEAAAPVEIAEAASVPVEPAAAAVKAPVESPVAEAAREESQAAYVAVKRPKGQALASEEYLESQIRKENGGESESGFVSKPTYTGQKISLDFQNADVIQVLRLISEVRGLNLVVHPEVTGSIPSLRLMNVPADQAQEIVLKLAGMEAEEKENILRVAPAAIFAKEQESIKRLAEAKQNAQPLAQMVVQINYAKAKDVKAAIDQAKILSDRGEVTVDERTNKLIVKDVEESFQDVFSLVETVDRPKRQVQIATRIVEMSVNNREDLGVNWTATILGNQAYGDAPTQIATRNARGSFASELASNVSFENVAPAIAYQLGSIADTYSLGLRIDALEALGRTKTISNPKIVTLDNEEATITQGEQIPYQTVSQEGTQTSFKDASLTLKVTPTIAPNGYIQIEMEIDNDVRGDDTPAGPIINTSRARTRALVKSGDTMVIGGVYKTVRNTSYRQVPYLGDVPGLGWLFKTRAEVETQRELMIFLTPMIVEEAS